MKNKKKSLPFRIIRIISILLLICIVAVAAYVGYVLISYHRIGDMSLDVTKPENQIPAAMETGTEYTVFTWNIGFGAYTADYDFFMDGGKQSLAVKEDLQPNLNAIAALSRQTNADIYLFEEVDIGGTRTWGVDERETLLNALPEYCAAFAQNYDSPYLLYPLYAPHGANRSGIMTVSRFDMDHAERVELPVEDGLSKLIDLDRCYMKSRIQVENGKELVVYTFHLSAYTSDGTVAVDQLKLLLTDMQAEAEKGNYCIAGGDFNKDILGNSAEIFSTDEVLTWAQPLPDGLFDGLQLRLVTPGTDAPSCRNPDSAYHEGQYVVTVDGFIVSDNMTINQCSVQQTGFAYSDHEPVIMSFILN